MEGGRVKGKEREEKEGERKWAREQRTGEQGIEIERQDDDWRENVDMRHESYLVERQGDNRKYRKQAK